MTKVETLIEQAKSKYPAYIHCRDKLSWKESMELGKECTVHCAGVYMDGSVYFAIRYKGEASNE